MSVSDKIKGMMSLKNKSSKELAAHLGILQQALNNKFYRGSFSMDDMISICGFLDVEFSCVVNENIKIVFDETDLRKIEKTVEKTE